MKFCFLERKKIPVINSTSFGPKQSDGSQRISREVCPHLLEQGVEDKPLRLRWLAGMFLKGTSRMTKLLLLF